jgi:hypothetical protein
MISLNNDLFEYCKIKCELEFINKNKYFERYERVKYLMKENLSELIIRDDDSEKYNSVNSSSDSSNLDSKNVNGLKNKFFIKFYENSDIKQKQDKSESNCHCKIFLCLNEEDRQEKIISTYKNVY